MKDFSYWEVYNGFSEGSGRSEKIWLYNPDTQISGLFKFKKDITTTDHISECIAYNLANYLKIPCARFELGTYNGREGSFSYNIITSDIEALSLIVIKTIGRFLSLVIILIFHPYMITDHHCVHLYLISKPNRIWEKISFVGNLWLIQNPNP